LQEPSESTLDRKPDAVEAFSPLFENGKSANTNKDLESVQLQAPAVPKTSGGKKGNPEFCQVTAYLRRDTYNKVRIRLLETDDKRDFSELVEELVVRFLDAKAE